jgi:predicted lipid-binding transport protein (Tim44 family)
MRSRTWVAIVGLTLGVVLASEVGDAFARARGGGGFGSRGSRSYSSPARPAPSSPTTPSSPSRSLNQPAAPVQPARPSLFGGLMGGLTGFMLGGLLGSLLFGGMGGFGGGVGLLDILLVGGGIALLIMFLRRRRAETPQPAYAGVPGGEYGQAAPPAADISAAVTAAPVEVSDVERGLSHVASMDRAFSADAFVTFARDTFLRVQAAVSGRDMAPVREQLTPEIFENLRSQVNELRGAQQTNRVERVDIRRNDISEAWQETGRDYVTVYFEGTLLDYVVDDRTGSVVQGSSTERQRFEEFWTFTRPVGPNAWRLSAIQSA